ncbi:sialidase family protein [Plantactinospora sp. B24E8]|uniref:sialidase family protein n=1 Tax=Plantactinospora sp. B24E8 TaxID=3153567 RepID=UPI00325EF592
MSTLDFSSLDRAARAAYKPQFAALERRARHRRRTRMAGAALLVVAVTVGSGTALELASGGGTPYGGTIPGVRLETTPEFIPTPNPSGSPEAGPPSGQISGAMVAGDLHHLYIRYRHCQDGDCQIRVAATTDQGGSWRTWPMSVPPDSMVDLRAAGPETLVAWVQDASGDEAFPRQYWLSSLDGGRTWREVTVREVPVLPADARPLMPDPGTNLFSIVAVDPATGELLRLARPVRLGAAELLAGVPVDDGLWTAGYTDQVVGQVRELDGSISENKVTFTDPAIEVSHDGGRTWRRNVLPEQVRAEGFSELAMAVHGDTAYVVLRDEGELRIFRSTDQGRSWRRAAGTAPVGERIVEAGVRPDGTLLIQAGVLAGEDPVMYTSADGGETLRPVRVGPGASAVAVPGGYAQADEQDRTGTWLSTDGTTWSYVPAPTIS